MEDNLITHSDVKRLYNNFKEFTKNMGFIFLVTMDIYPSFFENINRLQSPGK